MLVHHFEGLSQRRSQWKGNNHCQLNLTVIGFLLGMPRVFRSRLHYTLLNLSGPHKLCCIEFLSIFFGGRKRL